MEQHTRTRDSGTQTAFRSQQLTSTHLLPARLSVRLFKSIALGLWLAWFAGTAAATDELPEIGDSAGALISPEQERRVGEAFLRDLRGQGIVIDDPELEAYIQSLGLKLASLAEGQGNPFTFFLVKSPVVNAFAVPGGFIGVHSGLILQAQTESELAGVVAHEVSHVTQRHAARTFEAASKLSLPSAVGLLGAILLGVVNPQAGQAAIAAVAAGQAQYALNFTRANEREADAIGMQLLARAGFNPHGMADFFERLQSANRYNDPANIPEFLRTHPVTTNRIAESRGRADQFPRQRYEENLDFHLARAKLRVVTAREPREALQFYEETLRAGQYQDERVARYGYALALIARGEYGKARLQLERLRQAEPERVAYSLAIARLNVAEKAYARALGVYGDVLAIYPDYRPAVLGSAEALIASGAPEKARAVVRDYMSHHEPDPRYYQLLAEIEGQIGAKVEARIAQSEYYYANGELELAVEQLKLAQQVSGINYYQQERVRARLAQFQKEIDEAKKEKHQL